MPQGYSRTVEKSRNDSSSKLVDLGDQDFMMLENFIFQLNFQKSLFPQLLQRSNKEWIWIFVAESPGYN